MAGCFTRGSTTIANANWHPRSNAFPVAWLLRNGRWADPYAIVQALERKVDGRMIVRYELRAWGTNEDLGEFATGDEAAVFAWRWFLARSKGPRDPRLAQTHPPQERDDEPHHAPGKANTPARTERD